MSSNATLNLQMTLTLHNKRKSWVELPSFEVI